MGPILPSRILPCCGTQEIGCCPGDQEPRAPYAMKEDANGAVSKPVSREYTVRDCQEEENPGTARLLHFDLDPPAGAVVQLYKLPGGEEFLGETVKSSGSTERVLRHGWGKCIYNTGAIYVGQWASGQKSGKGREVWADGAVFEGEYLNGKKHGFGVYFSRDGAKFRGQFHSDHMQGEGTYHFPDGSVYKGHWENDQMNGNGEMTWPDDSVYKGQYTNGTKEGDGVLTFADGRMYDGQWKDGAQHGWGSYVDRKGRKNKCEWIHGRRKSSRKRSREKIQSQNTFNSDTTDQSVTMS